MVQAAGDAPSPSINPYVWQSEHIAPQRDHSDTVRIRSFSVQQASHDSTGDSRPANEVRRLRPESRNWRPARDSDDIMVTFHPYTRVPTRRRFHSTYVNGFVANEVPLSSSDRVTARDASRNSNMEPLHCGPDHSPRANLFSSQFRGLAYDPQLYSSPNRFISSFGSSFQTSPLRYQTIHPHYHAAARLPSTRQAAIVAPTESPSNNVYYGETAPSERFRSRGNSNYVPVGSPPQTTREIITSSYQRCRGTLKMLFSKYELWLIAGLVALLTGASAAYIEYSLRFLSDLRGGICGGMFWQPRWLCCGSYSSETDDAGDDWQGCPLDSAPASLIGGPGTGSENAIAGSKSIEHTNWYPWSELLQLSGAGSIIVHLTDYAAYVFISVMLATLAATFCQKLSKYAAGSGIPEIKTVLNGFDIPQSLSLLTLVVKCIGLALAVASGLSIGKEGPMIHLACSWAAVLAQLVPSYHSDEKRRRELITAAAATGVSVAFGAPLGGVLYSMEEVAPSFPLSTLWSSFFCAVVGALLIRYMDASGTGRLSLFRLDSISLIGSWETFELIPFAFIGLLGGIIGTVFIRLNITWMRAKRRILFLAKNPVLEVTLLALATAFISYPVPLLRANSDAVLQAMFRRCGVPGEDPFVMCTYNSQTSKENLSGGSASMSKVNSALLTGDGTDTFSSEYNLHPVIFMDLLVAIIIKLTLTVISFGTAVPAGCFVPSLTIGALMGRVVGLLMVKMNAAFGFVNCHNCIHPGVYAIVGAAATLGGATRVTISIVVIMFELTGGLGYVLPFMVAVLLAKWSGEALAPQSISEEYIELKGYSHLETFVENSVLDDYVAADASVSRLAVIVLGRGTSTAKATHTDAPSSAAMSPALVVESEGAAFSNSTNDGLYLRINSDTVRFNSTRPTTGSTGTGLCLSEYAFPTRLSARGKFNTVGSLLEKCRKFSCFDNGFPVIATREDRRCLGFVNRGILQSALEAVLLRSDSESVQIQLGDSPAKTTADTLVRFSQLETDEIAAEYTALEAEYPDVRHAIDLSIAVDTSCVFIDPDKPMTEVLQLFRQLELKFCVLFASGKCEGLITRRDLVQFVRSLEHRNLYPDVRGSPI